MIEISIKCDKCGKLGVSGGKGTGFELRRGLSKTGWRSSVNNPLDLCPDCYTREWADGPVVCSICGVNSGVIRGARDGRGLEKRKELWRAGWRELGNISHCPACHKKRIGRHLGDL